jgi:C1A family cysteine protease
MTARRTVLMLVVSVAAALFGLPQVAGAAGLAAQPQSGPLSPAFVEALHDPLVAVGLGRVPSPVEVHVDATTQAAAARAATPAKYDLRALGRVTPVKDQGTYSTCWAFANIAALESKLMPADPAPDFSEDNLVSRSGFGSSQDWRLDYGGYDFMAVAYFARWAGPVDESADPYDDDHLTPAESTTLAHVQKVVMIPGRRSWSDNALVKRLVRQNGALSVGMFMDQGSYLNWSTDSYYCPSARGENHGVTIVGWDDDYRRRNFRSATGRPPGNGAFLVRNTWGTSFGGGGYFWVSYYDRSFAREQGLGGLGGMTSYAGVQATDNYSAEYQHDDLGVTDHWGYGTPRVWGASRFTATADQTISAAGFYTLASDTRYRVWAGPTLKTMSLRASGTRSLPGYGTVPFSTPLAVTAGQFVVAVKLYSPGEDYPLAMERPATNWMKSATAVAGESYVSRDGVRWTDAIRVQPDSSVCIKAFAQ